LPFRHIAETAGNLEKPLLAAYKTGDFLLARRSSYRNCCFSLPIPRPCRGREERFCASPKSTSRTLRVRGRIRSAE